MNSILTVVTPAANYDLVSLEMVKTDQDITDGSLDAKISTIWIPQASSAVATYCKRVLVRETVSEQFRDVARQSELILTRYPVASITSVEVDDVALAADEYEFDGPTGFLYRLCNGYRMSWYGEKIMVVYIGGFALPNGLLPDIQRATLDLIRTNRYAGARDPLVKRVDVPGVIETEYWVSPDGNAGLPKNVTDLLDPHRSETI